MNYQVYYENTYKKVKLMLKITQKKLQKCHKKTNLQYVFTLKNSIISYLVIFQE